MDPVTEYLNANVPLRKPAEAEALLADLRRHWPQINGLTRATELPMRRVDRQYHDFVITLTGEFICPLYSYHFADLRVPLHCAYDPLRDTLYFAPWPMRLSWEGIREVYARQNGTPLAALDRFDEQEAGNG